MDARPVNPSDDREAGPATLPTSADVARRANVSRATVSYVLNGVTTQKISDKTREAVRRAAEELGYRPNRAAQSLAAGASRIAMFVVPSVHLGELSLVVSSQLTARAAERGVTLIAHFQGPTSRPVIDVAQDLRPRVVFSMFGLDADTTDWLQEHGIPVVSLLPDGDQAGPGNDRSGWLQVEHLVSRGHARIAYADTTEPGLEAVARMRRRGVVDACAQHGLEEPVYERFDLTAHGAQEKVRSLVGAGITAVASYNDEVAITVLAGIRRAGLRCPEDLAVIGVDEMAINGSMEPPLSSIEFDVSAIALLYADALSDILDGDPARPREASTTRFLEGGDEDVMRVVVRESTG
ncbi:LacI family DNA-binding transcriptional regulator [Nocardioides sp. Iso805N]|uniref:LacI family DNA-binding transcriptional regulator n=1 Tax=Nocardioides sp. Iso805N TaxID=1283287 RepID=UPI00036B5ECF|nr:LacI family DNA-binding transcriptional regulator [Nocardioides sp. Iso805N]